MSKATYTIVGTSVRNGTRKLRYSNGDPVARGRRRAATGNTEIALYKLPEALTKPRAQHAFDELFRNKTTPAYKSADFDYETIGKSNRTATPESGLIHRALKYIEETA